jgi:hypothetical protein
MNIPGAVQVLLDEVVRWASERADVQAAGLAGSYARGTATDSSDVDVVLLVDEPGRYLADTGWTRRFGRPVKQQVEPYGRLTSLRVWYAEGPEVEFGLTTSEWAARPLEAGTEQVIMEGFQVLFEKEALLSPLVGSQGM